MSKNNNREWYHEHKAENKVANAEFEVLIQTLIFRIGEFDRSILHNDPKALTFKLVRDTRFSHDKSPYHPAFRAHISSKGKLPVPVGYYLMIKPDNQSFLGGGSWYLEYPIRDEELNDADAFIEKAAEVFRIMKPFNDYLNKALVGFRMPTN